MTSSSVSFRISRHTQDLAETVHALSQRLVTMERRLESLELQLQALRQQPREVEEAEAASVAPIEEHIERLLQDCRQLLSDQPSGLEGSPDPDAAGRGSEQTLPSGVQAESEAPFAVASWAEAGQDDDEAESGFPAERAA
jgi:TolA-binding protein